MEFTPSAVSAPGKVLLAGGYLVLDKDYSGLVFALNARIHCVSSACATAKTSTITVRSPQFADAEWIYAVTANSSGVEDSGAAVVQTAGGLKNPFVETAVCYVASYLFATTTITGAATTTTAALPACIITIYADNDYYSQPSADVPRFNMLGVPISAAHKTGLGSSAALVTSLIACLLRSYAQPAESATAEQTRIHNLSQAAHCAAQGKVGSGFDVAAAVFGSCLYHRFSPHMIEDVGDASTRGFATRLRHMAAQTWDLKVEPTRLPPGLRLLMGDVDCGSSTPIMVKSVLAWRKEQAAAAASRWDVLEALNRGLAHMLDEVRGGSGNTAAISGQLAEIRSNIRAMGEAAGVAIEPSAQTRLLDAAVQAVDGVLGGVVPGAGGWDAVCFLLEDRDETVARLTEWLRAYADLMGETGQRGRVTPLQTREEMEGVRNEDLTQY